jgi:hypothetical protein
LALAQRVHRNEAMALAFVLLSLVSLTLALRRHDRGAKRT